MKKNQASLTKGHILIVDDSLENLNLLYTTLTEHGYEVRKAISGAMALMGVQAAPPDLILLDIRMPDISGYEVCQRLKADEATRDIPIIFLSALDEALDKVKAFAVGGIDYITKPFHAQEVLARTESQLALRAAQLEVRRMNQELEQRVQQRTAELEAANWELRQEIAERHRVEQVLQDRETLLRSIFETMSVGIALVDQQGYILSANEADCNLLGYSPDELVGMHFTQITHPDDLELDSQLYQDLVAGAYNSYVLEKRYIRKDGGIVWGNVCVSLIRDGQGQPRCTAVVCEDITARKQAEQALQESEERLRSILSSLEEIVWSTSPDMTQLLYLNPAAEQVYDRPLWEFFEDPKLWLKMLHPEDRDRVQQAFEALPPHKSQELEYRIVRPDQTVRWIRDRAYWIYDTQGQIIRRDGIAYDITERKQAEEALRQQVKQEKLIAAIAQRIRQSLDLDTILNTTVSEIRQVLQVDRVVIYRFHPDWSGTVIVESVTDRRFSLLGQTIQDRCFAQDYAERYREGRIQCLDDVQAAHISSCYSDLLTAYQIRANVVVPIVHEETLWGLLMAHHCTQARLWSPADVTLLKQLATQVAIAVQQSELYQQVQQFSASLEQQVLERTAQLQQAREFDALLKRITDKVRDSLDENQILQTAVRELSTGLSVAYCDTALYDLEQHTSTVLYEFTTAGIPSCEGMVWQMHEFPDFYTQLLRRQWFQFCNHHMVRGWMTLLACPIFDDQGILGDLWLAKPKECLFNEYEIQLVQQVANHCAIAIRQARLYAAAQAQVETLESLHQLKDDFLSTVSHELRSPVTNMKMSIQMLEVALNHLQTLPESIVQAAGQAAISVFQRIDQYMHILDSECDREISLVNDLLDLQRLEANPDALETDLINLDLWLPTLVESFQERARTRQQDLIADIPARLPQIHSNIDALSRILSELLHNACKYTPPGERIVLNVSPEAENLRLQITNFGTEIPASELPRIFEKFYRVISTDQWRQGGTGLGLALVQKLVQRLGGTIHVTSGQGKTSFLLLIPQDSDASALSRVELPRAIQAQDQVSLQTEC